MKRSWFDIACLAIAGAVILGPCAAAAAPDQAPRIRLAGSYSASGTHQCRTEGGEDRSCVVTGVVFGNCIDAASSLRSQDCCPSTRLCNRDAQGRETQCRSGGRSSGFTLNYCIYGQ